MSDEDTENEDTKTKLEPTIRYLHKLGSGYLDIIFEASKWVFEVDKESGLEVSFRDWGIPHRVAEPHDRFSLRILKKSNHSRGTPWLRISNE